MRPFLHALHIFSFKYLCNDVSHRSDTSEILQSVIYVIRWFLAMDGSGQEQFQTAKIGVHKSASLFLAMDLP